MTTLKQPTVLLAGIVMWLCACGVCAQGPAAQLSQWHVAAAGTGAHITIAGTWPDGCNPGAPAVEREGNLIRLHMLAGPAPGMACFSAIRPWQHAVLVSGLAAGPHEVVVSYELRAAPGPRHEMGGFSFEYPFAPAGTVPQGVPVAGLPWLLLAMVLLAAIAGRYPRRMR